MKIYILPVPSFLQPPTQGIITPPDNNDFGVEQDFFEYIQQSPLRTHDPDEADWNYLPIFWNRAYLTMEDRSGRGQFEDMLYKAIAHFAPIFTVCEYDPLILQPNLELDWITVIFTASRRDANRCIDIPLLVHPHMLQDIGPKRHLASFSGNFETDGMRIDMHAELKDCKGIYFSPHFLGIRDFALMLQESFVALAPRGQGLQSFRFYEAMQAGTVPLYISDDDARPFKKWIDWESCSLYRNDTHGLCEYLHSLNLDELREMGYHAQKVYYEQLQYGKWCEYLIKTLEEL